MIWRLRFWWSSSYVLDWWVFSSGAPRSYWTLIFENKKQLHKSKPRKEYADDDDEDEEDEGDDDDDDDDDDEEEEEEEYDDDDDFLGNRLCDELMTCHLGTSSLTWESSYEMLPLQRWGAHGPALDEQPPVQD